MSIIESVKCDACRKISNDFYTSKGWIELEYKSIAISKGRDEHQLGLTLFKQPHAGNKSHFCCAHCFMKWVYGTYLTDCDIHIDLEDYHE